MFCRKWNVDFLLFKFIAANNNEDLHILEDPNRFYYFPQRTKLHAWTISTSREVYNVAAI